MIAAAMRAPTIVVALSLTFDAGVARADGFDGQRFVPAAGAAGGLGVVRPLVPQHLGFGAGAFTIDPVLLASIGGHRWDVTLNLGFRARLASKNPDFTGGKELHWGVAATFGLLARPRRTNLDLVVEWVGGYQPSALGSGTIRAPKEVDAAL